MPFLFDPVELAMLSNNGFMGVTQAMKEAIADELDSRGAMHISEDAFIDACWACDVDPANLKQSDINDICRILEGRIRARMDE